MEKQYKRQQNLHKAMEEENMNIIKLQNKIQAQQEQELRRKNEARMSLKSSLQDQMQESYKNKVKWKKMSDN